MTWVTLDPSSTTVNTGAVTGAASAHAALSDGSDSSYVTFDPGEAASFPIDDLTLPSGGVVVLAQVGMKIVGGASSARTTVVAGSQSANGYTIINWATPSEVYGAQIFGGLSDSDVDGASIGFVHAGGGGDVLVVYELWCRVMYLTKPTVTVTAPTGTITQNTATVSWTPSFDIHADSSQHYRQVKIFSSAQYGAGGFDPSTSTATADSGTELGRFNSKVFSTPVLANGAYRAYVRVAAANSPSQWSDWDYEAFTVSAPSPAIPTLTLTPSASSGAMGIRVVTGGGTVTSDVFEVQRSLDLGSTFDAVRTTLGDGLASPTGGTANLYDYETPNGGTVVFRARALNQGSLSYSDWKLGTSVWSSDAWWLKHPFKPSLNREINVRSYPGVQTQANQGVFRPLGGTTPVVVSDARGPVTGEVRVLTDSQTERDELMATIGEADPLLLHGPLSHDIPDRWVSVGDVSSERIVDSAGFPKHDEVLPFTVVARPDGALVE